MTADREALLDAVVSRLPVVTGFPYKDRSEIAQEVVDEIERRFPNLVLDPPASLYRLDRPRARKGDPETSTAAAERVRDTLRRPGGQVHRLLSAYMCRPATFSPAGFTAREVEEIHRVKGAHRRTSELLADGLLRVLTDGDGREVVRDGGRVLVVTDDGTREYERMQRTAPIRE